jgi:hypothetical protein
MNNIFLFEISRSIGQTTIGTVAERPFIDHIAQIMSRTVVPVSGIVTFIGFLLLIRSRKIGKKDYSIFATGMVFLPTLITSFQSYPSLFWRALPVSFLPFSLGASYIYGIKRHTKKIRTLFLIIIISFNFVLIHDSFYDRQIFTFTKNEYDQTNFLIDKINYNQLNRIISHFRIMMYFRTRIGERVLNYYASRGITNYDNFDYVVYTVGLGKSYISNGLNIEEFYKEMEQNNIIYNNGRGNIYHIIP